MNSVSEFRFLEGDAAHVGRVAPLPEVRRLSAPVSEGRTVSALAYGDRERAEVVFLHGIGLNAHTFDRTILALDVDAFSIDLPGHGHSDWRADADYRPALLAADVELALESLLAGPVHLIGHSLGSLVGSLMIASRPGLVKSFTLLDLTPSVPRPSGNRSVIEFITGQREYDSVDEIVERAIAFGIGSDRAALARGVALNTRTREDGKLVWIHHMAHLTTTPQPTNTAADAVADTLAEAVEAERPYEAHWKPLDETTLPLALVRGTTGIVTDEMVSEWQERLPDAPVRTLNAGHNLHEHAPVELAQALSEITLAR